MIRSALAAALVFAVGSFVVLAGILPSGATLDPPQEAFVSFEAISIDPAVQDDFIAALKQFMQEHTAVPEEGGEDDDAGLGPTFNDVSCAICHRSPAVGGGASRFELRTGEVDIATGEFTAPAGGTLVRQMAVSPECQQRIPEPRPGKRMVKDRRRSTSLFGVSYLEVLRQVHRLAVQAAQPVEMRGVLTTVKGVVGINPDGSLVQEDMFGTFGWKCQVGDLATFAGDALVNELSVTNMIFKVEPLSVLGGPLTFFKKTPDPEDKPTPTRPLGNNLSAYTFFMRRIPAPPRNFTLTNDPTVGADVAAGEKLFTSIQCAVCHTPTWTTAPAGSKLPGLQVVDAAHGNKLIHPYSDLMLHDIGTGDDGVVQGGGPETRKMYRTAPLWGVRTVPELGHDGRWANFEEAIQGHAGQAAGVRVNYNALTPDQRRQVKAFLLSL